MVVTTNMLLKTSWKIAKLRKRKIGSLETVPAKTEVKLKKRTQILEE